MVDKVGNFCHRVLTAYLLSYQYPRRHWHWQFPLGVRGHVMLSTSSAYGLMVDLASHNLFRANTTALRLSEMPVRVGSRKWPITNKKE